MERKVTTMKDMTVGNPMKHIIRFAIPMLIGNIFQQIYNVADTIIVGQYLGEEALAGVGSTGNSTGPHLHLEVRVNGVAYNPQNYVY